jgi:ABC-2 type transport system ATP-binding protein
MSSQPILVFKNVRKVYGRRWLGRRQIVALDGVTLEVVRGEIFGLLGPNRAGKTTLIKVLLSICKATSGRVTRFGLPLENRDTLASIGYMHDSQAFPRHLTAIQVLEFYGALSGASRRDLRDRIPPLLARTGLADRGCEPIRRYSKGMVQRLALAQALVNDPELLVLDEPAEGMDLLARRMLGEVLLERRRAGRTAVIVSHGLKEIASLCTRVAVLREGKLAYLGGLDKLNGGPASHEAEPLETSLCELYEASVP